MKITPLMVHCILSHFFLNVKKVTNNISLLFGDYSYFSGRSKINLLTERRAYKH